MIKNDIFIDQLRETLSIVDVIGKKVTWDNKKTNISNGIYWACCPFHSEKTASFKVDQNRGFYYCFGCHEKGDSITFIMKNENLDFLTAIERLANEIGLKLPTNFGNNKNVSRSKSYSTILEIQELASFYFTDCLKRNPSAKASLFIKNRISSEEVRNNFRLGYASEKNKDLFNFLVNKGYEEDIIIKSGLCARNDKGDVYDRFRDRIIFPIHNLTNKVVGFGGRALNSSASAKYLNSPETEVFHKGKLLFNEYNCQKNLKNNNLIIVEGYMDVIALSKVGFKNCVAPLGTAVTIDQLNKIWRISKSPIFAFDGDISGVKALDRLIYLVLPYISSEKTIQACILPNNNDPDDLISKFGKQSIIELINKSKSLLQILWDNVTKNIDITTPEKRVQLENKLNFIINQIQERNLRHHYSQAFNRLKLELFGFFEKKINNSINYANKSETKKYDNKSKIYKNSLLPNSKTKNSLIASTDEPNIVESRLQETAIVLFLINHPNFITKYANKLNEIYFTNKDVENIFKFLIDLNSNNLCKKKELIEKLNDNFGQDIYKKLNSTGPIKINPLLNKEISSDEAEIGLNDVLNRKIARQYIDQELNEARENIFKNEDETLTWRIDQANKFFNKAVSGKNNKESDEQNKFVDDLKSINDLIKDKIWIKKNY
ncbi:MAG: DNA primase [Paracoccaceae bacterium]